ncbi:MAG: hypothetical protein ACE5DI_01310 [Candidatus Micrarchaeia archaeon]
MGGSKRGFKLKEEIEKVAKTFFWTLVFFLLFSSFAKAACFEDANFKVCSDREVYGCFPGENVELYLNVSNKLGSKQGVNLSAIVHASSDLGVSLKNIELWENVSHSVWIENWTCVPEAYNCFNTPVQGEKWFFEWEDSKKFLIDKPKKKRFDSGEINVGKKETKNFRFTVTCPDEFNKIVKWDASVFHGFGNTTLDPWFDTNWYNHRDVNITEFTGNAQSAQPVRVNVTSLWLDQSVCTEIRVTNSSRVAGTSAVNYEILSAAGEGAAQGSQYCEIVFLANASADESVNYSVYYNNSAASDGSSNLSYNNNASDLNELASEAETWFENSSGARNATNANFTLVFTNMSGARSIQNTYDKSINFGHQSNGHEFAQVFQFATPRVVDSITVNISRGNGVTPTDNVYVSIEGANASGAPNGTVYVATLMSADNAGGYPTSPKIFNVSPVALPADVNFTLVLNRSGASGNASQGPDWLYEFSLNDTSTTTTSASGVTTYGLWQNSSTTWDVFSQAQMQFQMNSSTGLNAVSPLINSTNDSGTLDFAVYRNTSHTELRGAGTDFGQSTTYAHSTSTLVAAFNTTTPATDTYVGFSSPSYAGFYRRSDTTGADAFNCVGTNSTSTYVSSNFTLSNAITSNNTYRVKMLFNKVECWFNGQLVGEIEVQGMGASSIYLNAQGATNANITSAVVENVLPSNARVSVFANGSGFYTYNTSADDAFDDSVLSDVFESNATATTSGAAVYWNTASGAFVTHKFRAPSGWNFTADGNSLKAYCNLPAAGSCNVSVSSNGTDWTEVYSEQGLGTHTSTDSLDNLVLSSPVLFVRANFSDTNTLYLYGDNRPAFAFSALLENASAVGLPVIVNGSNHLSIYYSSHSSNASNATVGRREHYFTVNSQGAEVSQPSIASINLTAPSNDSSFSPPLNLTWSVNGTNSSYDCLYTINSTNFSYGGVSNNSANTTTHQTYLAAGTHEANVTCNATDSYGTTVTAQSNSVFFNLENDVSAFTIYSPVNDSTLNTPVTSNFSVEGMNASYNCNYTLDSQNFSVGIVNNNTFSSASLDLSEGTHYVNYTCNSTWYGLNSTLTSSTMQFQVSGQTGGSGGGGGLPATPTPTAEPEEDEEKDAEAKVVSWVDVKFKELDEFLRGSSGGVPHAIYSFVLLGIGWAITRKETKDSFGRSFAKGSPLSNVFLFLMVFVAIWYVSVFYMVPVGVLK